MGGAEQLARVLTESKSRTDLFIAIFEECPTAIVVTDKDGQIVYANRAYLDMLETIIEDVRGDGWKPYIHPVCRQQVYTRWEEALAGKDPNYMQHVVFLTKSAQVVEKQVTVRKYNGSNFIAFIN